MDRVLARIVSLGKRLEVDDRQAAQLVALAVPGLDRERHHLVRRVVREVLVRDLREHPVADDDELLGHSSTACGSGCPRAGSPWATPPAA